MKTHSLPITAMLCFVALGAWASSEPEGGFYHQGMDLYQAGRTSEAIDSFEQAVKHKDHASDAQSYIDRIRQETVEHIRNKALTGVSKSTWQTKFFYVNSIDNRVRVGISSQEVFDRDSVNFRPEAIDALQQLADILRRSNNSIVEMQLINEVPKEETISPEISAQQVDAVFCFLARAANSPSTASY